MPFVLDDFYPIEKKVNKPMPTKVKVYIASTDKTLAHAIAVELRSNGLEVVSRWHDIDSPPTEEWAMNDLSDVKACDALLSIGAHFRVAGGKHVEFGYALALGKTMIHLGPKENIFHELSDVHKCERLSEALALLLPVRS